LVINIQSIHDARSEKHQVQIESSHTEMYPRIPWELVADPLGSAEHNVGTTALTR